MKIPKILIVDDEPDILEILQYNLKKEGFETSIALSGKQAISMAKKSIPDLILLDIMMPELNGIDVCKSLRKKSEFDNTLITFLTAKNEDMTQIKALDAGGDDFIVKPIRPKVLISRINAILRRGNKSLSNKEIIRKFGDLKINKEKVMIKKEGKKIQLTKKEFKLLWLLTSKPGKVFGREEIFNKVWGKDVIVGPRTIDVHVRKLREKLGENYIATIKGVGYKFEF